MEKFSVYFYKITKTQLAYFLSTNKLFQDLINHLENLLFLFVRMNYAIWIAGEHCGEMGFGLVVEDMTGNAEAFGVGELVADTERWACAFTDEKVTFAKPDGILVVNLRITSKTLLFET